MPGILSAKQGVDLEEQVFYFDHASWKDNIKGMTNEMLYVLCLNGNWAGHNEHSRASASYTVVRSKSVNERFVVPDQTQATTGSVVAASTEVDASSETGDQVGQTRPKKSIIYGRVIDQFELRAIKGFVSQWDFDKSLTELKIAETKKTASTPHSVENLSGAYRLIYPGHTYPPGMKYPHVDGVPARFQRYFWMIVRTIEMCAVKVDPNGGEQIAMKWSTIMSCVPRDEDQPKPRKMWRLYAHAFARHCKRYDMAKMAEAMEGVEV